MDLGEEELRELELEERVEEELEAGVGGGDELIRNSSQDTYFPLAFRFVCCCMRNDSSSQFPLNRIRVETPFRARCLTVKRLTEDRVVA